MSPASNPGFTQAGSDGFTAPPAAVPLSERPRRRIGQSIMVAAAAILLVMGAVVLWPANTEPALAAVQGAAATTAETETGRATTTFTASATDSTENAEALGTVEVTFAGRDVAFALDLSDVSGIGSQELDGFPLTEGRYVDDVVYANLDGEWISVQAPGLLTDAALRIADPRNILITVQELVQTERIGETTIDGMSVTHYQSVVDLGADTLGEAGLLAGLETQMDADVDGEVTIDLYVDDQGRMYRVDVAGDLNEPDGPGTADFQLTTIFSDLDTDITVEAPANAVEFDLGGEMFDGMEEELEELENN